jgi:hypothetical protein
MNERIRELAIEAGAVVYGCGYGTLDFDVDHFAKLIVQECIKEAGKDENGPAYEAVARIARHFGVK